MSGSKKYSPELRERAVRTFSDKREDCPSEWVTFSAISKLRGMMPEALERWCAGPRSKTVLARVCPPTSVLVSSKLKREYKDFRRANAVLKDASMFFAA